MKAPGERNLMESVVMLVLSALVMYKVYLLIKNGGKW